METSVCGKKRQRSVLNLTEQIATCNCCEECNYRFQEILSLKQELNDKIYELNNLIQSIHNRFNEQGQMLSYIN